MEIRFDVDGVQRQITAVSGFENCIVSNTDGGVSTEVYKLHLGNETYYLRLAQEGEDMASEALAHRLLLEKGVKLPLVVAYGGKQCSFGRSYLITSEIAGDSYKKDPSAGSSVVFEAGRQLALVNSVAVANFGWIDLARSNPEGIVGCYSTYAEFALNQERIESMVKDLVDLGKIDLPLADKYLRYIAARKGNFNPGTPCLAHGDFDRSHIFSKEGVYQGIIDFGDIRCTSIYHDLAHFWVYARDDFPKLLEGYNAVVNLGPDCLGSIQFEAMLFGLGKYWWVVKNLPDRVEINHPALKMLNDLLP